MIKRIVILLLFFSLLLTFLAGCCTNCLIARSELAGQKDLDQENPKATEIWAGDIESTITSEYGGNLKSYTVDGVSPLIQQSGFFNSDLLLSCDTSRQLGVKEIVSYNSEKKATVRIVSSLTNPALKLEKNFRMNFDTGDIYISKCVLNNSDLSMTIDAVQKMSLAKGGFLLIPVNVASQYPNAYRMLDPSGEDISDNLSCEILRVDNKIIQYVSPSSEFSISTDSTEGWFGYFYKNTLLLVKFSPYYTNHEKKGAIIFKADVINNSIIASFGETSRVLPGKDSNLKLFEKIAIIKLRKEISNYADVKEALSYLKVQLIVGR